MGNNPSSGPYLERQFSQASGQDAATIQVTKRKERYMFINIFFFHRVSTQSFRRTAPQVTWPLRSSLNCMQEFLIQIKQMNFEHEHFLSLTSGLTGRSTSGTSWWWCMWPAMAQRRTSWGPCSLCMIRMAMALLMLQRWISKYFTLSTLNYPTNYLQCYPGYLPDVGRGLSWPG